MAAGEEGSRSVRAFRVNSAEHHFSIAVRFLFSNRYHDHDQKPFRKNRRLFLWLYRILDGKFLWFYRIPDEKKFHDREYGMINPDPVFMREIDRQFSVQTHMNGRSYPNHENRKK
jgi:hypothetical protein